MELQLHPIDIANLRLAYATISSRNPKFFPMKSSKKDSAITSKGLQKCPQKNLSRILRTEAAIKAIERKATSSKYNNLWPKAVLEALDDAIEENRWESALKIFGLLRNQQWYEPKCQAYTRLLVMLGKCRQPSHASLLLEILRSDGLQPTVDVYTALVGVYCSSGLLDQAIRTVDDMKSVYDCKPDAYTYSILIKCCMKLQRFDMLEQLLAEMAYLGIECGIITYNTIINGYGKAGLFDLMEQSLTDMIESSMCLPEVYTLNSVIGAYGNSGNIEKMERWFNEFQLMGVNPDIITYNILIKSYGRARNYEKMGSVLQFMKKRFYTPTVVTYNTIIETYGKAGKLWRMEETFLEMKHQGIQPNSRTYCSLVSAFGRAGLLSKVDSIMRQVENSNVVLDTAYFNCIINAYGRAGDIGMMTELFWAMKDRKCKPDHITFATMIQAYNAEGMTETAQELESMMIALKGSSETKLLGGYECRTV